MPALPPRRLCEKCSSQIADVVLGVRAMKMNVTPEVLSEYRHSRLRELLPTNLFAEQEKRKAYHMKEILMLKPQGARVLVKRMDAPKPTSSLIEIPDTIESESSLYAIVLAIGTKVSENIKVADTVILKQYVGAPVTVDLDGEVLEGFVVNEEDVLAVVED